MLRGLSGLILVACTPDVEPVSAGPRPDILLVTIETTRADHVGPLYGYDRATFPRLSERSRSAMVYTRAFSASSWTLPSVSSIYTGLSPLQHTVDRFERQLPDLDRPLLGEALSAQGYQVAFFGVNPVFTVDRGLASGVSHWQAEVGWPAGQLNQSVFAWMDQQRDATKPLFLHVHYFDPHCPYTPPDRARLSIGDLKTGLGTVPSTRFHELGGCYGLQQADGSPELDLGVYHRRYDAELRAVDESLERLRVRLSAHGVGGAEDLVVVTADHGEAFWEHDNYGHSHSLWGETTWVPLVVWGAGQGTHEQPVSLTGIYGTVLGAAGVDSTPTLDTEGGFAQGTIAGGAPWLAWIEGGQKWMTNGSRSWQTDVSTDPLDASAVPTATSMPAGLRAHLTSAATPAPLVPTDEERGRLRALGYSL